MADLDRLIAPRLDALAASRQRHTAARRDNRTRAAETDTGAAPSDEGDLVRELNHERPPAERPSKVKRVVTARSRSTSQRS